MNSIFRTNKGHKIQQGSAAIGMVFCLVSLAAWFTHIFVCFSQEKWGFLIAGAIFFPVAMIHGVGVWFGFW
jgi:hypothetical protein